MILPSLCSEIKAVSRISSVDTEVKDDPTQTLVCMNTVQTKIILKSKQLRASDK